ncbi:hypothetical protein HDU98_005370 [Podochytrium sp. JEL0797]|nr:hypothetical protein HDU98_005370 [Podochytrium sp. JEL0797]
MHLIARECDKLLLTNAGLLAQRRLWRGLKLNYSEACALIATVCLELIRDGNHTVAELMSLGRTLLGREDVQEGVAITLHVVQIEGTFPDGTKLVTIHEKLLQMTQPSIALVTVRRCVDALCSKKFELATSHCDESAFVAVSRPASVNIPNRSLAEYLAYFAMFESFELTLDEKEFFEFKKGDRTVVICHFASKGTVAGTDITNELMSTLEINEAGLIVRVVDFSDSRGTLDNFKKMGL